MALLRLFTEGKAATAVTNRVKECLPSPTQEKTLAQSQKQLQDLTKSALFRWSDETTQGSVRVIQQLVTGLSNNQSPAFDANQCAMLQLAQ
eukprot:2916989-Amphidinium_carterae.1